MTSVLTTMASLGLSAIFFSIGAASAWRQADEKAKLIEGAKKEGKLVWYTSTKRKNLLAIAVLFGLQSILTTPAIAQELKGVRFGYASLGFRQGHIWVAKDEGLFKKFGFLSIDREI